MKKFLWPVILVSLGLNVILAWQMSRRSMVEISAQPEAAVAKPADVGNETRAFWSRLQPEDAPALVERLRAAGFPGDIVRAIVRARVAQEFQERRKALDPEAESRPFWKRSQPDPKAMAAQRQLVREQQARIKELLGPDADASDPMTEYYQERQFGELSADKMVQVRAIQQDFQDKQMDLFSDGGGMIVAGSAIMEKIRELERQQRDGLAKILSPAELEQYDFRNSPTGATLRMRTAGLDLSEQEFRTLYQLQDAIDQEYSIRGPTPPSPEIMRGRAEAEQQMNEQFKALLGPARYAEYERSLQPDYRNTTLLVSRLELPPETTQQIWGVREDFMQRATAIRTNRSLPPAQRTEQLTALQQEVAAAIAPLVGGTRNYEAYHQYGGSWIERLVPQPPAGVTPSGR